MKIKMSLKTFLIIAAILIVIGAITRFILNLIFGIGLIVVGVITVIVILKLLSDANKNDKIDP